MRTTDPDDYKNSLNKVFLVKIHGVDIVNGMVEDYIFVILKKYIYKGWSLKSVLEHILGFNQQHQSKVKLV